MGRSTNAADLAAIPIMPGVIMGPAGPPLDGDARARVAEGEDGDVTPDVLRAHVVAHREGEGNDDDRSGGVIVLGRLPPHLVRSPRLHLHRGAVRRVP